MRPFGALTRRGQARRLRALALEALRHYDLEAESLTLVSNETNCSFRVRTRDGRSYFLRIGLPDVHAEDNARAEVIWLEALSDDGSIIVPRPLRTRDGRPFVRAGATGVPEARICIIYSWLPGIELGERVTPELMAEFGRTMALLHRHGASFELPAGLELSTLDCLYPLDDREVLLCERTRKLFGDDAYELLVDMRAAVLAELERLYAASTNIQLLHGDLHWWNASVHRKRIQLLDFEDLIWGFPVQDIAITLYYTVRHPEYEELREAFRRGYESEAAWPEEFPGQIELLMVHRGIDLLNFVLSTARPPDDPLIRHFEANITVYYRRHYEIWRKQTEGNPL